MQHSEADGGLEEVGGEGSGAVFGSRVQPWESRVDAQTAAAISRRHDWGRAFPSEPAPGTVMSHHCALTSQARGPHPSLATHSGDLHAKLSGL